MQDVFNIIKQSNRIINKIKQNRINIDVNGGSAIPGYPHNLYADGEVDDNNMQM